MYGFLQLLGIILSPIHGFIMDKHVTPSVDISPRTQQMANILNGIIVLLVVAVVDSILTMVPSLWAIIVVFILQSYLKAAALSTVFAFVTHVHFPQIHYGKLVGASLFCANIVGLLQYPMREFIQHDSRENIIHVQIIFICLLLVSTIHPVNVWRHCRDGLIKDMSVCELERRRKSVTETLIRRLSIDSRPSITYDDTCRDTTIAEIADTLL